MNVTDIKNDAANTEVKTDNRHVSFKECFPDGWREYFRREDVLLKVLEAAGLTSTHDFVQVNSRYLIDNHRIAIILLLRRKGTEILDKVIVDVTSSHPRFEQLMDVFYNIGSDCDYRVIVYDENDQDYMLPGVSMTEYLMAPLRDYLRGRTFLSIIGIDLLIGQIKDVALQFSNIKSITKYGKSFELPDRRIIEVYEFWGGYMDDHDCDDVCPYGFGEDYSWDRDADVESQGRWTDGGMFIEVHIEADDYAWLFTEKLQELKDFYQGCSFEYSSDNSILTIKKEVPFRNFVYLLPRDKGECCYEFRYFADSGYYVAELLSERDDEGESDTPPSLAANTSPNR
jgi:hypothetical protein